jgi:hypothetical protein
MADTIRTRAALLSLLADNTSGDISPQDIRDFLVSVHGVYGEIYKPDGAFDGVNLNNSTWTLLDIFTANGQAVGTTPDHANDKITVGSDGIYVVTFNLSMQYSGGGITYVGIRKNAGATPETGTVIACDSVATDQHAMGNSVIMSLSASDELKLVGLSEESTASVAFYGANLIVHRIA